MRTLIHLWLITLVLLLGAPAAMGETTRSTSCTNLDGAKICIRPAAYVVDVCEAIATLARRYELPEAFFARLIWQESRFDPTAISPAGAQGIAQFMAGTARLRRLDNAFDPAAALAKSAEYLRELEVKYGNLGLAAAAYNAGRGASPASSMPAAACRLKLATMSRSSPAARSTTGWVRRPRRSTMPCSQHSPL